MPSEILYEQRRIFSKQLRHWLEFRGYSQADLARRLNVSTSAAADWCNEKKIPRMDKVQTICNWLGIQKSDLLEEKPVGETTGYYLDPETARMAQELLDSPGQRMLLDATRDLRPEDMDMLIRMAKALRNDQSEDN